MEATLDTNEVRVWKRYDEYREIDTAWVTTAPEHWEFKRLKWTIDGCQNGIWGGEPTGEEGEDLGCVRVADFDRDNLVVTGDIELTMRSIPISKREGRQLVRGNLLLEKSGGGDLQPVGAVVLFDSDAEAVCSNFVAKVSVPDGYSSSFLRYLHAGLYAARVNKRSLKQSTGIQNLDSDQYFDEKMALPPHDEQQAIAAFLDRETARMDALIGHKERLIALLEEKRQAVISHAVTRGLDPNAKMKNSGVPWLGDVPESWIFSRLKFACTLIKDGTHLPPQRTPVGFPLLSVRNIVNGDFVNLPDDSMVSEEDFYELRRQLTVTENDVLLAIVGATIGKVAIVREMPPFAIQRSLAVLRVNPLKLDFEFLSLFLQSTCFQQLLWEQTSYSAQPGIYLNALENFNVPLPEIVEQGQIIEYVNTQVEKVDWATKRIRDGIERLQEYRTALISAAVTGQIDVREEVSA